MLLDSDQPTVDEFAQATGWRIEPQGACRGDVCIPLPNDVTDADDRVNVDHIAELLGMGVVRDDDSGLTAVGPASNTGRALPTTEAPELVLPDFDGNSFDLRSLRGTKVVLVAWAPY